MNLNKRLLEISNVVLDIRDKAYGSPSETFQLIAQRWSATLGVSITPQQVGILMIDLKLARHQKNPTNIDNLIDIIGYACCLADILENDVKDTQK